MPKKRHAVDVDDLVRRYLDGESSNSIARGYGCDGALVLYYLRREGVRPRSNSEGQLQRIANNGTGYLSRNGAKNRGVPKSALMQERRAITFERTRSNETASDRAFAVLLERAALRYVPQKAIGPYNVDFAVGDAVAVEIVHGGTGRFRQRQIQGGGAKNLRKKLPYLLDRGWDVIVVVITARRPELDGAAEYLVAHLQGPRRDRAQAGHYWVIWGTGEAVASRCTKDDDIALVRARVHAQRV